jgi:type II secretory pathway pseudopilin PulG
MNTVQEKGYTVLELMIVLAVSAGMFSIVAVTFGGKQQQAQFTQGVRDFDSRIKDISNDVSLGYYPANESVGCNAVGGIITVLPGGTADALGSNNDCISIGKVLQFSPGDPSNFTADDDQIIKIFNVVGLRESAQGTNPTTVVAAAPAGIPNPEQVLLKWGLRVRKVVYANNVSTSATSGLAIFSELNRGSQLKANASNESVQISLIPGVSVKTEEGPMITEINSIASKITNGSMLVSNVPEIVICVTDADNSRQATITFGGSIAGSVIDFDNYDEAVCA